MHLESPTSADITFTDLFFGLPALIALVLYIWAVHATNRRGRLRKWPWHRTVFWILGVLAACSAVVGPLAVQSHSDFTAHMIGHLLLGMLAPLLMALAAPMSLLLRTLHTNKARRLSRLLKCRLACFYTNPIVTSILNIGGLWLLYTTNLYTTMHESILLHILVHTHVFIAGYLFTISLIYIDPVSHRHSFSFRTVIFILALAGHGILSKFIYAYPPEGVPTEQARSGAMLMYYGGDAVDLFLIFILFLQWYKSIRPRPTSTAILASQESTNYYSVRQN